MMVRTKGWVQRTTAGVDQGWRRGKGGRGKGKRRGGEGEERLEARGLWQSTQGLEAKRLIPQEALHPVLIRREFYERFERYPLCELGSRREYAWRDAALYRLGLYGNIGRVRKGRQDDFVAHRTGPTITGMRDVFVDSVCLPAQRAIPVFGENSESLAED